MEQNLCTSEPWRSATRRLSRVESNISGKKQKKEHLRIEGTLLKAKQIATFLVMTRVVCTITTR